MTQTETPKQFLRKLFEFNYCEECGGGEQHHTVCGGPFGNYFAKCDYPPSAENGWQHPVIAAYRKERDRIKRVTRKMVKL